jgi:hypothetical protein
LVNIHFKKDSARDDWDDLTTAARSLGYNVNVAVWDYEPAADTIVDPTPRGRGPFYTFADLRHDMKRMLSDLQNEKSEGRKNAEIIALERRACLAVSSKYSCGALIELE